MTARNLPPLAPGERLLWEGAPSAGFRVRGDSLWTTAFGLAWVGIVTLGLWTGGLSRDQGEHEAMFTLLLFFGFGLYLIAGHYLADMAGRAGTRYALTNRGGYVSTSWPRRRVRCYPITAATAVELSRGARDWTIHFATELDGETAEKRGFEFLRDGERVWRLVQAVQGRAA